MVMGIVPLHRMPKCKHYFCLKAMCPLPLAVIKTHTYAVGVPSVYLLHQLIPPQECDGRAMLFSGHIPHSALPSDVVLRQKNVFDDFSSGNLLLGVTLYRKWPSWLVDRATKSKSVVVLIPTLPVRTAVTSSLLLSLRRWRPLTELKEARDGTELTWFTRSKSHMSITYS